MGRFIKAIIQIGVLMYLVDSCDKLITVSK